MNTIQLRVKKADKKEIRNWVMSIYNPEENKESVEFRLAVLRYLGEYYLDFVTKEESPGLRSYINELANSKKVELVIKRNIYKERKREVKELKRLIEMMDSDVSSRKVRVVMV